MSQSAFVQAIKKLIPGGEATVARADTFGRWLARKRVLPMLRAGARSIVLLLVLWIVVMIVLIVFPMR